MKKHLTRRGDGALIEMTSEEIMSSLEAGTEDAADRGKIAPLSKDDLECLLDIFMDTNRFVSVEQGEEVVVTHDIGTLRLMGDQGNSGVGIPLSRVQGIQVHERAFCSDTMELGHIDYSFKPVKPVIAMEQQEMENALLSTIIPLFYGAMPNLGTYYSPDGPFGNPSDLLPAGKVKEAYEAQEGAVEHAIRDMVYVGEKLAQVGCDGINFDTTGAAGDADFKATLHAVELLKKNTNLSVQVGMAGEFVLGMHGGLEYEGKRLAGLYCNDQVKLAEKAGADIFGPVVNTKPSKDMPWNLSRAVTFVKACVEVSNIPIHVNMGMGVGGSPIFETPPIDSVSRASKAMVKIAKVDGLQIGVGDPMGMSIAHGVAAGMGGIRTAGDLVARMQMARKMRINDAKAYVAKKLKISPSDLSDVYVMRDVREELDIGIITSVPGCAKGIEAKARIAQLLDIEIASVNRLKNKINF